jgi:hypothetical protein
LIFFFFFQKQRNERAVVLWSYSLENIMPLCKEFEQKMIKYLWRTRSVSPRPFSSASTFSAIDQQLVSPSVTSIDEGSQAELNEKTSADIDIQIPTKAAVAAPQRHWWSWKLRPRSSTTTDENPSAASSDPEKGGKRTERKLVLIGPIYAGFGAAMAACAYKFIFFSSLPSSLSIIIIIIPFPLSNAQWLKYPISRFHDICSECSSRRVCSGWELCSIWFIGDYACHFLRFNRKSTVACRIFLY